MNPTVLAISDAAGVPLALLMAGYTGVLLSSTSTPVWSMNPWLGPLFSAGSISSAAGAISLMLDLMDQREETPSKNAISKIETAAHVAEAVALAGYVRHAGDLAKPLTHGSMRPHFVNAITSTLGPEILKRLPLKGGPRRAAKMAGSLISVLGVFSLRWAIVHAGVKSGNDPAAARANSRGK